MTVDGTVREPTLEDLWQGRARFVTEVQDTGLPMGESETIVKPNGEWWSYVHASWRSAGVRDLCAKPVDFPGCTVIYKSRDGGGSFSLPEKSTCLIKCLSCPCISERDHIDQQQYPRIAQVGNLIYMVYEYRARVMLRTSADGVNWSPGTQVGQTGIWNKWLRHCSPWEIINKHPFAKPDFDCLAGAPPGIVADRGVIYVFVGMGQNPAHMGCLFGSAGQPASAFQPCNSNPLFTGAPAYGDYKTKGADANPYFDFRTISSARTVLVGEHFYMLYEGDRGPGLNDPGDTQFGLGLARSRTREIDGPWEKFPANPLLTNLPGNIGLGHADVVLSNGQTVLFTSLDGITRSRLTLQWK